MLPSNRWLPVACICRLHSSCAPTHRTPCHNFDATCRGCRDGVDWGDPQDSVAALTELGRALNAGYRWFVLAWPSLWWVDQYPEFNAHLSKHHHIRSTSPHALIYELTP